MIKVNGIIILVSMLFLHIVDDYYLQGILAQMKQKKWWEKNAPNKLYKNDYIVALVEHAFSWSFMIMLPIMVTMIIGNDYSKLNLYTILLFTNCIIHSIVDDFKANKLKINLIQDQSIHILQILVSFLIFNKF